MESRKIIDACEKMIVLRRSALRQALMKNGMHLGQPEMLSYVMKNPGCSQRQMADDACVTPASVAASFKRMEHAGLIHRRSDTADLRCNRVYITERGAQELTRCLISVQQVDTEMLSGLSEADLDIFYRCMEKINENLQEKSKK